MEEGFFLMGSRPSEMLLTMPENTLVLLGPSRTIQLQTNIKNKNNRNISITANHDESYLMVGDTNEA